MRNKVLLIFSTFTLLLISYSAALAEDENLTITTYYPSPYGSYNELQANTMYANKMYVGSTYKGNTTAAPANGLIVQGDVKVDNGLNVVQNVYVSGKIGIGISPTTSSPDLDIGTIKIRGGTLTPPQSGYVLTSDAYGNATWKEIPAATGTGTGTGTGTHTFNVTYGGSCVQTQLPCSGGTVLVDYTGATGNPYIRYGKCCNLIVTIS